MRTFFVSRTDADKEMAQWIAQELEAAGHTAYIQDWDSRPGKNFVEFMEKGAEFETIAVLSPGYLNSPHAMREWRAALLADTLIPVRVRECEVPKLHAAVVYIDFVGKTRDRARQDLLDGIKRDRVKRVAEFPGESGDPKVSIAKLPTVNSLLIGREAELKLLDEGWAIPKSTSFPSWLSEGLGKLRSPSTGGIAIKRRERSAYWAGPFIRRARRRIGKPRPSLSSITLCANGSA